MGAPSEHEHAQPRAAAPGEGRDRAAAARADDRRHAAAGTALAHRTRVHRRRLRDLMRIESTMDFHRYAIEHAIGRYRALRERQRLGLGSVLSIGSTQREASRFVEHPFDSIVLTGVVDCDDALGGIARADPRVRYEKQNCERLGYAPRSFDLVFCKESLHHLARPVQGLYELLRVCRAAALVLEPYDSQLDALLRRLGLSSVYESNQLGNLALRDNFVYRWDRRQLEQLLRSLYLESGSELELTLGWMSSRFNGHRLRAVRRAAAVAGWLAGFVPGSRGNYMTALVVPGSDLPPDPDPL
ncbi:MAG TPA: class I SAM-dependent methyltransferase [Myxococcota bacterium]|nr:class I SAM-dependent methyltransferase [Myxococcota bacterium]